MTANETDYDLLTRVADGISTIAGGTAPGSGTAANPTTVVFPSRQDINLSHVGGSTISTNAGPNVPTTLRVTQAVGGTYALTEPAATTLNVSQTLVAAVQGRQAVLIANDTDVAIVLRFGAAAATTTSYTVKVPVGGIYEVPTRFAPLEIRCLSATGAAGATGAVHVSTLV